MISQYVNLPAVNQLKSQLLVVFKVMSRQYFTSHFIFHGVISPTAWPRSEPAPVCVCVSL